MWIFFYYLYDFEKIFKIVRNVTNFEYIFVTSFHSTLENFTDDWTHNLTIMAWNFLRKRNFLKLQENSEKFERI